MANFTEAEQTLVQLISDTRLRASLAMIREAMEDIWAGDSPRIVQDFTEHGVKHSERLAGWAVKLLNANFGKRLSETELYLLLAGIYLHDIGMQCDVVKHPEIKARSEALGAEFSVVFAAKAASQYSLDEQKAIRSNHQYLSAAWIDYASLTHGTALGLAAATIPEDLVDDLMDVCMYHARLPISDCPLTLRFDPRCRKRFVAALLRFSDELDIDGHRVSIKTVLDFSMNPNNAIYWWLHHRAKVIFSARNVILMTVRLHPDDAKLYGSLVQFGFINQFQEKNHPVLTVLALDDLPLVISADSQVVESRDGHLPSEIIEALLATYQVH